jgi:hypothetical protein
VLRLRGGPSRYAVAGSAKARGNAFIDKVRHEVEKQNSDVSPDFWSAFAASENAGFVEAVGTILAEEDDAEGGGGEHKDERTGAVVRSPLRPSQINLQFPFPLPFSLNTVRAHRIHIYSALLPAYISQPRSLPTPPRRTTPNI